MKLSLFILRLLSLLVPNGQRARWLAEWGAELQFSAARGVTRLVWARRLRAAGAHALFLRYERVSFSGVAHDIRFAIRVAWRQPLITGTIVGTLALGIGANTAFFSVMRATLLKPLPLAEQHRLVMAWQVSQGGGKGVFSYPDFNDWRTTSTTIDAATAMASSDGIVSGVSEADRVPIRAVTASFFPATGVTVRGRGFSDADSVPGSERVAIVTEAFRARLAGRDPLGAVLQLNGLPRRVVGVIPGDPVAALFPTAAEAMVPLVLTPQVREGRGNRNYSVLAHLKPGATVDQANRELIALMARLGPQFPQTNAGRGGFVRTLRDELAARAGRSMQLAGLVTSIVLLVACANIAGLLLARNAERSREFAVRTALGAGRWRIARQLVAEATVLAVVGSIAALLTLAGSSAYLASRLPATLPRRADVHVDAVVVAVALGLALLTALVASLPAALFASSSTAAAFGNYSRSGRLRKVLVAAQFAAAVSVMICVGLLSASFARLQRIDPGFSPDRIVTMQITVPRQYTADRASAFVARAISAVESKPGVAQAGLFGPVPFSGFVNGWQISSPGVELAAPVTGDRYTTTENAMTLMGVSLIRGRLLEGADFTAAGAHNVVIDEVCARKIFGDDDPIGRTIRLDSNPLLTVVGVTRHIRHHGFDETSRPQVYVSFAYDPISWLNLVVRVKGDDPDAVIADVRRAVLEVDPAAPPYDAATIRTLIDRSLANRRTAANLAASLAAVTMLIAVAGLYGAMAFSVERRRREIGVRMALGARRSEVARMVLAEAAGVAVAGLAIGLPLAMVGARLIKSFLFNTSPFEPVVYVAVACGAMVVAIASAYAPARRAASVDPLGALRSE